MFTNSFNTLEVNSCKLAVKEQCWNTFLNIDNILWSKGINSGTYKYKPTEYISSNNEIIKLIEEFNMHNNNNNNNNNNNIFWIRNTTTTNRDTDLDMLANNINYVEKPFILITSDGDRSVPSSYNSKTVNTLLNSVKVLYWFTQNYDRTVIHNKLKYMPIGLDLHTSNWFINDSNIKKLEYIISKRMENREKIKDKIVSDFHLSYSHIERKHLHYAINYNEHIFFASRMSFKDITDLYNQYQFVLSPRGNGLDCHRTWELFLAGAIIITKTTPLDNMFIENNLPVVILQEWEELNENIEEKLKIWYDKYHPLTSVENIYPKMTFNYWLSR